MGIEFEPWMTAANSPMPETNLTAGGQPAPDRQKTPQKPMPKNNIASTNLSMPESSIRGTKTTFVPGNYGNGANRSWGCILETAARILHIH